MRQTTRLTPCPPRSLELLQEAIDVLDGTEPAMDQRGEARDAIVAIDRLTQVMQNHDAVSYPKGSRARIFYARDMLNTISFDHSGFTDAKEAKEAKEALDALLRQWCVFWAT